MYARQWGLVMVKTRYVRMIKPWILIAVLSPLALQGCVGTLVGAVVDTTIEVAKVPFKVGKAVVDVASSDEKKDK